MNKISVKIYLYFVMGVIWSQCQILHAQNLFSNGSFESGDFGSSSSTFAGQTANKAREARGPDNQVRWSLDNWTFSVSDSGNFNRWVSDIDSPVMAQSGSKYVYLSSDTTDLVNNSTLRYGPGVNFTAGNTYRFSFYAADANSQTSGAKIGFEINPLSTSGTTGQYITLTRNQDWSDHSESIVPWVQYNIDWIPDVTIIGADFYWSVLSSVQGSQANVVMDNVSMIDRGIVIPESETLAAGIFISTMLGFTWLKRRTAKNS